jgi:AsmA family protein
MSPKLRRAMWPLGALAVLLAGLGVAESTGWRFLAGPAERWLSEKLARDVSLGTDPSRTGFRLSLLGPIRLQVAELRIGNPPWSQLGPMLQAKQVELRLRWRDLLAARGGQALNVQGLRADGLALQLERLPDGRASWQFGPGANSEHPAARPAIDGVHFDDLAVGDGQVMLADGLQKLKLDGHFGLKPDALAGGKPGWVGEATGRWGEWPVKFALKTGTVLPEAVSLQLAPPVPLVFDGSAGRAHLKFDGLVKDLMGRQDVEGRFQLSGPSLAAVGQPFGVTLPTTQPFTMQGKIAREGTRWRTQVQAAHIGRSDLAGDFEFDRPPGQLPKLTGELRGDVLWLADLGPTIGVEPREARPPEARAEKAGRVLPDRPLDLPSLSVMQADVRIALARLELGHPKLESVHPLRAHLTLKDSVLSIEGLDATLAQGRLWGSIQLDGRRPPQALWKVDLSASGLKLEEWIAQSRPKGQPPYVTGELGGRFVLTGRGRSAAQMLATSDGSGRLLWSDGTLSHLVVEGAGIDLAQALGVLVKGDDALPVTCGAADLQVKAGQVEPRLLVVDTPDSTLWAQGSVSLADEKLDLVARVEPKDMSPLALRTPLRVRGTLSDPAISLEKGPLARRAVPALLLGLINPLAALLPLVDPGSDQARDRMAGCQALVAQAQRPAGSRPPPKLASRGASSPP